MVMASTSQQSIAPSCPYARVLVSPEGDVAVAENDETASVSLGSTSKSSTVAEAVKLAKSFCPAFAESKCPFRDATDAASMKRILSSLPPSHVSTNSGISGRKDAEEGRLVGETFQVALEHVHNVSAALHRSTKNETNQKYELPGGCPFKTIHTRRSLILNEADVLVPFVKAMEEFSLSAIMGRLAESNFSQDHHTDALSDAPLSYSDDHRYAANKEAVPPIETDTKPTMPRIRSGTHLSSALKNGTAESHAAAESVSFVKEFIRGNIDRTLYATLILNLYSIYFTMEEELDKHAMNHFPTLHFPKELNRTSSLEDDLDFFYGDDWKQQLVVGTKRSEATRDYCNRIRFIAQHDPLLLLSHAYTRYLGDLSGGRILARVARKALGLDRSSNKDGLSFYEFEHIKNAKKFKDEYRMALDDMHYLSDDQIERLVAEANVTFVLNMRVFEELDVMGGMVPGAVVRPLSEATKYFDICVKEQEEKRGRIERGEEVAAPPISYDEMEENVSVATNASKCPFAFMGGPNPHKKEKEDNHDEQHDDNTHREESKVYPVKSRDTAAVLNVPNVEKHNIDENSEKTKLEPKDEAPRCPWPFIFFHDPTTGMKDYQTWVVIGVLLCWMWTKLQNGLPTSL